MNRIFVYIILVCAAGSGMMTSCMVGPKFSSPQVTMPDSYIDAQADTTREMSWWATFDDTTLVRLIGTAITHNRDLAMAISSIEQARITMNATRSEYYPSIGYSVNGQYGNETYIGTKNDKPTQNYTVKGSVSWELGLFGKVRRMVEADRNNMYASEMAARGVLISLVAEVASTYFDYLQYEYSLDAAKKIYQSQKQTYDLQRRSYEIGAIAQLDFEQASVGLYQAEATVTQMKRALVQTAYALSLLLGENPSAVVGTHTSLNELPIPDPIPTGLPADLLNRRPDIMEAYYQCGAANSMIGVAQAQRLPSIALTGAGGLLSPNFTDLFKGESWLWSTAGSITGPIFSFGKYRRQVLLAREKSRQSVLNYQQTVLAALEDVESSLIAVSTLRVQTEALKSLRDAAQKSYDLSDKLYSYGQINSQNLLDALRTLLNAETTYAQSMSQLMSSYSTLYKSLGGGY